MNTVNKLKQLIPIKQRHADVLKVIATTNALIYDCDPRVLSVRTQHHSPYYIRQNDYATWYEVLNALCVTFVLSSKCQVNLKDFFFFVELTNIVCWWCLCGSLWRCWLRFAPYDKSYRLQINQLQLPQQVNIPKESKTNSYVLYCYNMHYTRIKA